MSVVGSASELPDSPEGGGDLNQRTWTRKFRVLTDDVNDGPAIVLSATGLPLLYSAYAFGNESDDYALLRELRAARVQGASKYWVVTCEYRTPEPRDGSSPGSSQGVQREAAGAWENPLLQWPEVQTSLETWQEVVYAVYDVDTGEFTPCKNSAGQVFDPPPTKESSHLVLTITRNEPLSANHPAIDVAYQDSVNLDPFWGCAPGTWKCQGVTTERQTKQLPNGVTVGYLRCTYKFKAKPTWDTLILDAGNYYLDAGLDPKKLNFISDDGHPRVGALDGFGHALDDGETPVFVTFRFYKRMVFALLALPQSFQQVA